MPPGGVHPIGYILPWKTNMQAHPAADIFPLLVGAEIDALAADIREHGQREPIIIHNGMILDGRNRARACEQLGIEPVTRKWDRDGTPEEFVISMNVHRRHLSESQRALVAAKIANIERGQVGGAGCAVPGIHRPVQAAEGLPVRYRIAQEQLR